MTKTKPLGPGSIKRLMKIARYTNYSCSRYDSTICGLIERGLLEECGSTKLVNVRYYKLTPAGCDAVSKASVQP